MGVRVVQRLTLTGTGDYFLSVPAPLLDVRAARGSQAEPGFRRSGILWQGFSNRSRVLAADAEVEPGAAAAALPLRVELAATVAGNELGRGQHRSGPLRLELRLRNTTAVRVQAASARAARSRDLGRLMAQVASELRKGEIPEQPSPEVEGPVSARTVVVDAPLVVSGELRLRLAASTGRRPAGARSCAAAVTWACASALFWPPRRRRARRSCSQAPPSTPLSRAPRSSPSRARSSHSRAPPTPTRSTRRASCSSVSPVFGSTTRFSRIRRRAGPSRPSTATRRRLRPRRRLRLRPPTKAAES